MNIDLTSQELDYLWRCAVANERQKSDLRMFGFALPFTSPPYALLDKLRMAIQEARLPTDPITEAEGRRLLTRIRGCEPEDFELETG